VLTKWTALAEPLFWFVLTLGIMVVAILARRAPDRRARVLLALAAINALNPSLETHHFVLSLPPLIGLWFEGKGPVVQSLAFFSTVAIFATPYGPSMSGILPALHLAGAWSLFAAYCLHVWGQTHATG